MTDSNNFNYKTFLRAIIPAYAFPAVMSGIPGVIMEDTKLMHASYTSIAIPSVIAAFICFFILWRMEIKQVFPKTKLIRTIILIIPLMTLALITIWLGDLQEISFNILLSTLIGSAVTTWMQPMSELKKSI